MIRIIFRMINNKLLIIRIVIDFESIERTAATKTDSPSLNNNVYYYYSPLFVITSLLNEQKSKKKKTLLYIKDIYKFFFSFLDRLCNISS